MVEVSNLNRAYSIKEVAEMMDVNESSIRYWDKEYGFYLQIPRTENNERYFTEKEIRRLETIKRLRERGLSSKAIMELLENGGDELGESGAKGGGLVPSTGVSPVELNYIKEEFKEFLVYALDERHMHLEDKLDQMQAEILASLDEEMVRLHAKLNADREVKNRDEFIRAKQENAQLRAEVAALRQELGKRLREEEKRRQGFLNRLLKRDRNSDEENEEMDGC